ncbi:hypothetical protein SLS62_006656 [Diatrype stigma]|uniref:WSC domain-containing protein n=1 Tax=Diatrype stigma TaxID=117547 RepID=A0AAN9YRK2_9PEZI
MAPIRFTLRALSLLCLALTGSASPHQHLHRRQSGSPPSVRQGCYVDNTGGQRALSADSTGSNTMTVQQCSVFCRRHPLFGLEYGRECWCGDALGSQSRLAPDSECSFPCAGDPAQKCGAGNRLDVYQNGAYAPRTPATNIPGGARYLGCYVDNGAPHPLPSAIVSRTDMTGARCAQNCAGYRYFGTEYGQECYCGDAAPASATRVSDSECSLPCAGNDDELCGAGQRLTVYERPRNPPTVADFAYYGCHGDSTARRALRGPQANRPDMTLETCAALCAQYAWFGVEDGSQCFCGASLDPGSAAVPDGECNAPCGGNSLELCGAANRLSVYRNEGRAAAPPRNKAVVAGASASNTTFEYVSCWTDLVASRALGEEPIAADDMTVEKCAGICGSGAGSGAAGGGRAAYSFFGVEFVTQCFCGNTLGGSAAPEADCSYVCGGDGSEWCGAAERMNLYRRMA